jgi:type IV pilus assembly protein PilM
MQTVSLAEFHLLAEGGLKLAAFKNAELIVDPAADATRSAQIEALVKELASGLHVKPKTQVNLCLTSQEVFSRVVKLPGSTAEDVKSIIGFEAQQNVPFPIDEVVWDYQIMGESRNANWDVALVAMKADRLGEVVESVRTGGLDANNVDVAPVALYNAFCYNYPEVSGASLLIDLGARTTNLIFCEDGRFFSRSIPIGGNTISAAIAKEFNQEITVAERLKIEKGIVGLGGAYSEPEDPTVARIAKVIRNTMTRLHAEVARSINFYRTSQGGSSPKRVFLCGGSASLPYVSEFFTEKLQISVEFFDPLRNVVVADGVLSHDGGPSATGVGEVVGTALRALKNCPIEINLRPESAIRAQKLARRKPQLVLAALFLILAPAIWLLHFDKVTQSTKEQADKFQKQNKDLTDLSAKIDKVLAEQKRLNTEAAPFLLVAAERSAWTSIVDELADKLPLRFIWITQLKPVVGTITPPPEPGKTPPPAAKPGQPAVPAQKAITAIEVSGLYLDNPPNEKGAMIIDEFYEKLVGSEIFSISEDKSKIITQRTTPTGESWAYGYTLVLPLKQPIAAP